MSASKDPDPPKPRRKRGRPERPLVIKPDEVGGVLDRLLGKKPPEPPAEGGPRVRSKKPRPS